MKQVISYERLEQDELNTLIDSMLQRAATNRYIARDHEIAKYNNNINAKEDVIISKLRGLIRKC